MVINAVVCSLGWCVCDKCPIPLRLSLSIKCRSTNAARTNICWYVNLVLLHYCLQPSDVWGRIKVTQFLRGQLYFLFWFVDLKESAHWGQKVKRTVILIKSLAVQSCGNLTYGNMRLALKLRMCSIHDLLLIIKFNHYCRWMWLKTLKIDHYFYMRLASN